jgi:hypothetical protein
MEARGRERLEAPTALSGAASEPHVNEEVEGGMAMATRIISMNEWNRFFALALERRVWHSAIC